MEPLSVLRVLWTYKWVTLPIVILTALACAYGMLWAPRTYESAAIHALAMPDVPSEFELEQDPGLAQLNQDNPYLRWRDTSLLTQVVVARMNSDEMAELLEARELATDFEIIAAEGAGSGLLRIVVQSQDPDRATETVAALGLELERTLSEVQKVNQADDLYMVEALPVSGPTPAEEVFSSRLRFTLVLGAAGALTLFGAVSLAQSMARAPRDRGRRRSLPAPAQPLVEVTDSFRPGPMPRRATHRSPTVTGAARKHSPSVGDTSPDSVRLGDRMERGEDNGDGEPSKVEAEMSRRTHPAH